MTDNQIVDEFVNVSSSGGGPSKSRPCFLETSPVKKCSLWSRIIICGAVLFTAIGLAGCGGGVAEANGSLVEQSPAEETADLKAEAQPVDTTGASVETESIAAEATVVEAAEMEMALDENADSADGALSSKSDPIERNPSLGEITFALEATSAYEPIDAGLFFTKGITEVHAIFEYSGMSTGDVWERVWRLNDKEIARVAEAWSGPEAGVFDYFVDNGGRPLPAGDWVLELYVEGELQSIGVFFIEAEEATADDGVYLLVYPKCDGDHHNIFVTDTDGSFEQLIVTRGAGPSWAAGGEALFFYGEAGVDRQTRDGLEYIFDGISNGLVAVNANPLPATINQLNLFQSSAWKQGTARWANVSPDGTMIAFDAKPSGDYRIYFLGTDSNQQFRYEIIGEQADWSPDSQQIVYRSGRDGKTGIWVSDREDAGHRLLTNNGSDSFPAWSPDGQAIAFSRDSGGGITDIYLVNVDGSDVRQLTETAGHDTLPTFAPNGDIIFRSTRSGNWGIWKMEGDGSEPVQIVADACVGNDWALSRMDVLP